MASEGDEIILVSATNRTHHIDTMMTLKGYRLASEVEAVEGGADADGSTKDKSFSSQQQRDWNKKQRYKDKRSATVDGSVDAWCAFTNTTPCDSTGRTTTHNLSTG